MRKLKQTPAAKLRRRTARLLADMEGLQFQLSAYKICIRTLQVERDEVLRLLNAKEVG